MKKIGMLISMLIALMPLFSNPVLESEISLVAQNWYTLQTGIIDPTPDCTAVPDLTDPDYWIVSFNQGWVVVSADDSCIPILAFSKLGSYTVPIDPVNEAAENLLAEYSLQIEDAKNNGSNDDTRPIWDAILDQTISIAEEYDTGLPTEQWVQWGGETPYNDLCPLDNVNLVNDQPARSRVGCVATAAAQICNYHKRWNYNTLVDSDEYTSDYHGFICNIDSDAASYDFPDFATLNVDLNQVVVKYNNNDALTDHDKAALSFACGILVEMDYSSISSSADGGCNVYQRLNMYFQYASSDTCSSEAWIDLIKKQLRLNRPIEYRGEKEGAGHAYIITGFQSTNMNTTLNMVNWGRPWCHLEYWSLQLINPASPYPEEHSMLIGIAPKASVTQTILLENGSTDYSGIRLRAQGHDGISTTITSDNEVFEFGLPPGTYDFTITDMGNYFYPEEIDNISIQMGTNQLDPIVLTLRPNVVLTDSLSIQEGINLVRNGGTVAIPNGNYTVSGLSWQDKHIKLQGQSQSGVIITNDPSIGLPAIQLSEPGIDNLDIISNVTFLNCDLTEEGQYRQGAAIVLKNGAAPIITNCTFDQNRVGNISSVSLYAGYSTGGAVFVGGAYTQGNTPRFENCSFTNNYTLNGNGGGAVAIYGQAQFTGCEFTNNQTMVTDGIENPVSRDMGGAVFIYTRINQYDIDIDFDNCVFNNNKGRNEADDVFVVNIDRLSTLRFNGCTFTADTPHSNGAKPAIKFLTDAEDGLEDVHVHLILTNNKFLSCRQGAVYFCDYHGKNSLTFTGNVVANNMYDGYGVYSWYPDGTQPENTDYFVFGNNTFSNIQGSGLILFQCPPTTINNTVFENCSGYGISWGDYEDGHSDWVTRGLTINNSLFSTSSPRYDFGGNTSCPLVENSVMSVDTMYLDSDYQPIWNSTTMSPCIDSGIGEKDPDGTPPDIGAKRAVAHQYWDYTFEDQNDLDKWYWVSYPVLNSVTNDALVASEFFKELLEVHQVQENSEWHDTPTYLEEIDWYNQQPYSILWEGESWNDLSNNHFVTSPQGYKVKLIPETRSVTLKESGFQTPSTLQFPIYEDVENWLGYFKEETQYPEDAFADIWNDIDLIKARNWSLYRDSSTGQLTGKKGTLNYGDMVILKTYNDHTTFQWGNNNDIPPNPKFDPKDFVFDEKPDYIPVYVSIPDSLAVDINEIGLYVDGVCKGAVVVEDNIEQISAYVDSASELSEGTVEYVFSYEENKSQDSGRTSIKLEPGKLQPKYGTAGIRYPYFEVQITKDGVENIVPLEYALNQNYPNPFNPRTLISYQLPAPGQARLDIYNVRGQLVRTLVNAEQNAGYHSVVWNGKDDAGRNVASGIYFYRLSSPDKTLGKRMLLMK
jgi:hypothetical protein